MQELQELFVRVNQHFAELVESIDEEQWGLRVPSTPEWTVQQLVGHVYDNNMATCNALGGVDTLKHDIDNEPLDALSGSAEAAERAVLAFADYDIDVPGPFGDMPAEDFLKLMIAERTLHGWDLANAIGADTELDEEAAQVVYDFLLPQVDDLREKGVFGPEVAVPESASLQDKLLGLTGRQP